MIAPTRPRCYVGIDPGKHGAVAWIPEKGYPSAESVNTHDPHAVADLLRSLCVEFDCYAAVEIMRVHAKTPGGKAQLYQQGQGVGIVLGVLASLSIPLHRFTPAQWQKPTGLKAKGDIKARSVQFARERYPQVDFGTNNQQRSGRSDALHIAEALRRQEVGV